MDKRVVALNAFPSGSTGRIMQGIAQAAKEQGYRVDMFAPVGEKDGVVKPLGGRFFHRLSINLSKATGLEGCFAVIPTIRLIRAIKSSPVDILHLHNLHHSYINLPLLFRYIKKSQIPVVWTLHDCWAFTGHCPHFEYQGCEKWKNGCHNCSRYKSYPRSLFDNSKGMYRRKKRWFSGLDNLTLVAPSKWLASQLGESFLKDYPAKVLNNGIDLETFCPRNGEIRQKYNIAEGEKLIVGVSTVWNNRKGLDVFLELAKELPQDYKILLVGVDGEALKDMPEGIIALGRCESQRKLAEIYSAADVFVNPTREDTFPTVNMEALACGVAVATFNSGGSAEIIDETCGINVCCDDVAALREAIVNICEQKPFSKEACRERAEFFDKDLRLGKYIELYDSILKRAKQEK